MATQAALATVAPAAIWEDFIDIFYAPSSVFRRRENSNFFIPLAVITILCGVLFYLNSGALQPMFDAEFDRQMAIVAKQNPNFRPEAAEQMRDFASRIIDSVIQGVQGLLLDPAQLDGRFRLSLGVGRFLDPDTTSPLLLAFMGRVDLITIWITVLVAIGLCVTGGVPLNRAAIAAALVWFLGGLSLILPTLQQI